MCMHVCTAVSAGSAFSPPIRGPPWRYLPVFRCAFWPLSYIPLLLRIVLCTRYKSVVAHYVTYSINIQCMHLVLGIGITFPSDKPIFFLFAGLFCCFCGVVSGEPPGCMPCSNWLKGFPPPTRVKNAAKLGNLFFLVAPRDLIRSAAWGSRRRAKNTHTSSAMYRCFCFVLKAAQRDQPTYRQLTVFFKRISRKNWWALLRIL